MATLDRQLRRDLEKAVRKARSAAQAGARAAVELLAVHHHEPWGTLNPEQRALRNRLRAHGRQLGDRRDDRRGTQTIDRLVDECAYEHWHRMLFARFLAENDLLIEPETGVALSLDECRELARERGVDWLTLASGFAERMLSQLFRPDDPVLEVSLPPEKRQELEEILKALPSVVFVADDSLGLVYQFWQAERKSAVDDYLGSGGKAGADEIPAKTQLFTDDYMVLYLLHNTLGAWWAAKVLSERPDLSKTAPDEDTLRMACALPGVRWEYLRLVEDQGGTWRPAAGPMSHWPREAREVTLLDPAMGSGHFLVSAFQILVAIRMREESLTRETAVDVVLAENIFGLEVDPRCTQIAAFNLAFAAWRMIGYRALPRMSLACSGLSVSARLDDWLSLCGDDVRLRGGMDRLFRLFEQAPTIGSLINPRSDSATLLAADYRSLGRLLARAMALETTDDATHELAIAAAGVARAAELLAREFVLVTTNVPYLARNKQDAVLARHCEAYFGDAKTDLATCFIERCRALTSDRGSAALVTPQTG